VRKAPREEAGFEKG